MSSVLLDRMVIRLAFWGTVKLFLLHNFTFPPAMYEGPSFFMSWLTFAIFFILAILVCMK